MDFTTFMGGGDFGTLALGLVIAGMVAGLAAGALGVGGGLVIVPVLYHVLGAMGVAEDLRMHIAVGTSLAAMVPSALSSLQTHKQEGDVDWALVRGWLVPLAVGVIAGSVFAWYAKGQTLALFYGIVALPLAVFFAFGKESWKMADRLPGGFGGMLLPFGIGGVSTMMGMGGESVGAPLMTLSGVPSNRASATASAFAVIVSILGALGAGLAGWGVHGLPLYSFGYVNLMGCAIVAPLMFLVAPFGAKLAQTGEAARLRKIFALLVAVTAVKMIWTVMG